MHTNWFCAGFVHLDPLYYQGSTSIPTWICNYIYYRMWDEITYPFPNFIGTTVEVWEWISNFMPHLSMLGFGLNHDKGATYWNRGVLVLPISWMYFKERQNNQNVTTNTLICNPGYDLQIVRYGCRQDTDRSEKYGHAFKHVIQYSLCKNIIQFLCMM